MASLYANLNRGRPYILSLLRIIAALLFLEHGLQKYFGFPSAGPPSKSALVRPRGNRNRWRDLAPHRCLYAHHRFYPCRDMAVAYFLVHFPHSFFPAVNGGDAAVLYCFTVFYLVFAGGGPWSLDNALKQV